MFSSSQKDFSEAKFEAKMVAKSATKPYRFVRMTINGNELDGINYDTHVVFPVMDVTVTVSHWVPR